MINAIRYDVLVFSPDLCKIKTQNMNNMNNNKEKKINRKCWYCESTCNTFISICDMCQKYRKNKK